jgi:hypothetical protein
MSAKHLQAGCAVLLLLLAGCKPVPTAPDPDDGGSGDSNRTYSNADWGFSISPPTDSLWSVSATQFRAIREPNGLSPVQVIMRRVDFGLPARPIFILDSFGATQTETLEEVADSFDARFSADFQNYNTQGQRVPGTVGGVSSVEWRFFAREPAAGLRVGHNLYLSVVFVKGDQIYAALCSGDAEEFPEDAFRTILGSFVFD